MQVSEINMRNKHGLPIIVFRFFFNVENTATLLYKLR